jgi:hypothetical protein
MAKKSVLAIGIDPAFGDFSKFPQLAVELLRCYIDAEVQRLRDDGYEVVSCLIVPGETAEPVTTAALTSGRFDCVVIGAGLREPPEYLLLFETIINLIHRLAPDASICFNSHPADTIEAVRRWTHPGGPK